MEDVDSEGSSFLRKSPLESQPNAEINFALPKSLQIPSEIFLATPPPDTFTLLLYVAPSS